MLFLSIFNQQLREYLKYLTKIMLVLFVWYKIGIQYQQIIRDNL